MSQIYSIRMETFYHLKNLEQILVLLYHLPKCLAWKEQFFLFIKNAELKQKEYPHFPECIRTIIKRKKGSKDLYNVFLSNINSIYN